MASISLAAATLVLVLQAAAPAALKGPWILECDMPAAGSAPGPRIFRIGPQLFQEWRPGEKRFGYNLCEAFSCRADANSYEGEIASASLVLTIQMTPGTGGATWSTLGASGVKATSGTCKARPDTGEP